MSYTSEQYKYLLMKRLQRSFSMRNAKDRAYTQSFFCKLLDDSITLTEHSYKRFVSLMDDELDYCSRNGIYLCEHISTQMIDTHSLLLIDAFSEIGIDLVVDSSSRTATFTKPNGDVMEYKVLTNISTLDNYFYINAASGCEYQYARASAPAYSMQNIPVIGLDEENPKIAGPGTYWSYNADTKTVTISGEGAYAGATDETQLGSGTYNTVILSANVSRLLTKSLNTSGVDTIVFFAPADALVVLDDKILDYTNFRPKYLTVYTDNKALREYVWPTRVRVTLHSLSEWGG